MIAGIIRGVASAVILWVWSPISHWLKVRRALKTAELKRENKDLKKKLKRITDAAQIEDDIDALSDDELRERMRNSPYRRD